MLPVVGVAEIEFGLQKGGRPDSVQANGLRSFCQRYERVAFDDNTIEPHALIRAKLFEKYGTQKGHRKHSHKEKLIEELRDRVAGKELGIDERDLMIASAAIQYNCVLVTDDTNQGMRRIREAAETLAAEGKHTQLRVENWRIRVS
jgi:predicted nucleic acid-binding protein